MQQLKIAPQGVRGIVNQGLGPGLVIDLVSAFGTWLDGGVVLVCRDTRPSSPLLTHAVLAALSSAGCEALEAGICPTAAAQLDAARLGVSGLISVTASHNDASWNGLKLFGPGGRVLTSAEGNEVLDLFHQGEFRKARHDRLGPIRQLDGVIDRYLDRLLARVDRDAIASARPRVVIDACNGAGAVLVHELCRRLGAELIPISCEPSGDFPHPPDPTVANMGQVAAIIQPVGAQVGFGLSSDCERVSVVTDGGVALGNGATLPLVAEVMLPERAAPSTVVASIISDSRIDRVAERHGGRVVRSGVGLQAVVEQMSLEGAVLGGEGSGGVALADFQHVFDGLAVLSRLLVRVAREGGSRWMAESLPLVNLRTDTIFSPASRAYSAVARVREQAEGRVTDLDGVRVELPGAWYHVRVSLTEPLIRIVCEADSRELADELMRRLRSEVRAAL